MLETEFRDCDRGICMSLLSACRLLLCRSWLFSSVWFAFAFLRWSWKIKFKGPRTSTDFSWEKLVYSFITIKSSQSSVLSAPDDKITDPVAVVVVPDLCFRTLSMPVSLSDIDGKVELGLYDNSPSSTGLPFLKFGSS